MNLLGGATATYYYTTTAVTRKLLRVVVAEKLLQVRGSFPAKSSRAAGSLGRNSSASGNPLSISSCVTCQRQKHWSSSLPLTAHRIDRFFSTARSNTSAQSQRIDKDEIDDEEILTVSILGPPNAGKSTLFNRLADKESNRSYQLTIDKTRGRKHSKKQEKSAMKKRRTQGGRMGEKGRADAGGAIVSAVPGTTRDRRVCIGRVGGTYFRLVDTAGVDGERLDHWMLRENKSTAASASVTTSSSTSRSLSASTKYSAVEEKKMNAAMLHQTLEAVRSSDLVFLMFDARVGISSDLWETARWLRKLSGSSPKEEDIIDGNENHQGRQQRGPIVRMLANKLEGDNWNYDRSPVLDNLTEASRVGFGEIIPISALQGEGLVDIAVVIEELTQAKQQRRQRSFKDGDNATNTTTGVNEEIELQQEKPLQLAILGRQNVGKSTLVNALLQQERVLVGATPGLTRDAIAITWSWNNRPVELVDTAGIRKRSQRDHSNDIEDLAVASAVRAMKKADVAVLVLDADAKMLQRQELAIADAVLQEGRALVIAANKMDLIIEKDGSYTKEDFEEGVRDQLEARFPLLRQTPIVPMSSLTGENVQNLMPTVFTARDRWARTIPTSQLNRWLAEIMEDQSPPAARGKPVRIKYIMQTKGRPPTFLLFCNIDEIPDNYLRFLIRNFQDTFEMYGMEIRMAVKKSATKGNPFKPLDRKKRGGSGLGGREARNKRRMRVLMTTGTTKSKRKRSRHKKG